LPAKTQAVLQKGMELAGAPDLLSYVVDKKRGALP
jgi:hypothetical protein